MDKKLLMCNNTHIIDENLIAWYRFNKGSLKSSVGKNNDLTMQWGYPRYSNLGLRRTGCYTTNAAGSDFNISNMTPLTNINNKFTVSYWFKQANTNVVDNTEYLLFNITCGNSSLYKDFNIGYKKIGSIYSLFYYFGAFTDMTKYIIYEGPQPYWTMGDVAQWACNMFTLSYDNGVVKCYIDGIKYSEHTNIIDCNEMGIAPFTTATLHQGMVSQKFYYIDNIRVYNKSLNDVEINRLFIEELDYYDAGNIQVQYTCNNNVTTNKSFIYDEVNTNDLIYSDNLLTNLSGSFNGSYAMDLSNNILNPCIKSQLPVKFSDTTWTCWFALNQKEDFTRKQYLLSNSTFELQRRYGISVGIGPYDNNQHAIYINNFNVLSNENVESVYPIGFKFYNKLGNPAYIKWYNLIFVVDGKNNKMQLYINYEKILDVSNFSYLPKDNSVIIGRDIENDTTTAFTGLIDNIRFYAKAGTYEQYKHGFYSELNECVVRQSMPAIITTLSKNQCSYDAIKNTRYGYVESTPVWESLFELSVNNKENNDMKLYNKPTFEKRGIIFNSNYINYNNIGSYGETDNITAAYSSFAFDCIFEYEHTDSVQPDIFLVNEANSNEDYNFSISIRKKDGVDELPNIIFKHPTIGYYEVPIPNNNGRKDKIIGIGITYQSGSLQFCRLYANMTGMSASWFKYISTPLGKFGTGKNIKLNIARLATNVDEYLYNRLKLYSLSIRDTTGLMQMNSDSVRFNLPYFE